MNPITLLTTALWSLNRSKLRTALTMLGIVIGVAAVVGMVSLGEGAKAQVDAQIAGMGVNLLTVAPGSRQSGGMHGGSGSSKTLVGDDAKVLAVECPTVDIVSPVVRSSGQVVSGQRNASTTIQGVGNRFLEVKGWAMARGSFFSADQERTGAKVCVLGETLVQEVYEGNDPIGTLLRVKHVPMIVIGVLTAKGQSSSGQDQDDVVVIPWTTAQRKLTGQTHLNQILVSARSEELLAKAEEEITVTLKRRHRIIEGEENDFNVQTQTETREAQQRTAVFMSTLVLVVAGISLIVGGIGVMNIMLVSVLERTREIGIRMAIGARRSQVLAQFLCEAVVLTSLGGMLGIALGVSVALVLPSWLGWPTKITAGPLIGSFCFSAAVGIGFGLWPALRASRLDPIEALRYE